MASFHDFTTTQLRQAVQIREEISSLQAKLDALIGGSTTPKMKVGRPPGKRTMSAESRAKMAAGQKARWAKLKAPALKKVPAPAKAATKPKRFVSPEVRAKLAAAMKARWASRKKAIQ